MGQVVEAGVVQQRCTMGADLRLERFDISYSVACMLKESAAVGGGYRCDGIGDGLA